MKKIVVLLALSATMASGQSWVSQSFLSSKLQSVWIGTNATMQLTNLESKRMFLGGTATNMLGVRWTNSVGTSNIVIAASSSTSSIYENPFADVNLWPDRNGNSFQPLKLVDSSATVNVWSTTNFVVPQETVQSTPATVSISIVNTVGNLNTNVVFTFSPLADGVNEENSMSRDWLVFVPVSNVATNFHYVTNAPMHKWGGHQKLRLKSVHAFSTAYGGAWITGVKLNGFVP